MGEACRTKGTGDEAGEKKKILGELPVYGQLSRFFGIGAEPDRRKGGSAYEKSRRELGRGKA